MLSGNFRAIVSGQGGGTCCSAASKLLFEILKTKNVDRPLPSRSSDAPHKWDMSRGGFHFIV